MERLTNKREADAQREEYERRLHTFAKAHVFGRDVTVYQGDRPNTLIIKGTEPEGFYDTPGGAT